MKLPESSLFAGFLLLPACAVLSGWLQAALNPGGAGAPDPGVALRAEIEANGFGLATREQMLSLLAGGALLLDARDLREHEAGAIPGAHPLPLRDFEAHLPELLPLLAGGVPMVVYCSGPECDDALRLALRLRELGFDGANIYAGGWAEWRGDAP